jgi:hypothetical protein
VERAHRARLVEPHAAVVWDQAAMTELELGFEGWGRIYSDDYSTNIIVVGGESTFAIPTTGAHDPYEYNDTYRTAAHLSVPTVITAPIGWEGDRDWYAFNLSVPSLVTATLLDLPADYELLLAMDPALLPDLARDVNWATWTIQLKAMLKVV